MTTIGLEPRLSLAVTPAPSAHPPSDSQRSAIEAPLGPLLVLAGPGAGKTFCLIERIRHLVEHHRIAPDRICAFTFTNKAAGEIQTRLERTLGDRASRIRTGTIHAFCSELLRNLGSHIGLDSGFGIADEEDQLNILRRIQGPRRWHRHVLTSFSAHRFRGDPLRHSDEELLRRYDRVLSQRNLLDFDLLVLKTQELLERPAAVAQMRERWDAILVDEFQDLNPVQYRIVSELARVHRNIFAVGDYEQSIYSWAGADRSVFTSFLNDFGVGIPIRLRDNRRCPREPFALARRLVSKNTPIFDRSETPEPERESAFPVRALSLETAEAEVGWIIDDLRRDCVEHEIVWGDVALLYRRHDMGQGLETAFLNAGIPCRLAQGRALADDPVIAYVLAALRVIAHPGDDLHREAFFAAVLPRAVLDDARTRAAVNHYTLYGQLQRLGAKLPRAHEEGRQIRLAVANCRNLDAIARRHTALGSLVQELLSRRVGRRRSALEERHDELTDPAGDPSVVRLAERLREARDLGREVHIPLLGGVGIPLKGMVSALGIRRVRCGGAPEPGSVCIAPNETPELGLPLGLFKAAQLVESRDFDSAFRDFTAIDIETTDRFADRSEVVEIAVVRVRDGQIVDSDSATVRPRVPISPDATRTHGFTDAGVADAPFFEAVWPRIRAFCGDDVVVAHNGYDFDFRILRRQVREMGGRFDLCTYDSLPLARDLLPTSRRLSELARVFGIDVGTSHRALDDTRTLAFVLLELEKAKLARARKTALVDLLGHLGVALALLEERSLGAEALIFRTIARPFALGRYSGALEFYESEHGDDESIPTVDEVIEKLGGIEVMARIRAERSADDRYPSAMPRMRRLIEAIPEGPLDAQLTAFLERAVLSRFDGHEPERGRVNLLTLHSTKGLEFSRVYILGVEDAQLPGRHPTKGPPGEEETEEARRLLYVGMTRAKERLVLTRAESRNGQPTGGHQFLDEMELAPHRPGADPSP